MQLIQWNWFLNKQVLLFNNDAQNLTINYEAYPSAVTSLLKEVLALQETGNRDEAESFIQKWTQWDPNLHGVIAESMKASESYRYNLVTYDALNEQ